MKTRHEKLPFTPGHILTDELFTETSVFFDIETTGFSPGYTELYLIGCMRRHGGELYLDQFFAEAPSEEKQLLCSFFSVLHDCDTIITYNGTGFDIPYLKAKCERYGLDEDFDRYQHLDIFKSVSRLKHIFQFENYRQKTIERFLHLTRNDRYNGGELIAVYKSYAASPDDKLLELLLLHNYEDVLGMAELLPVLSYERLFRGDLKNITDICTDRVISYDGSPAAELTVTFEPVYPLPKRISHRLDELYLSGENDRVSLVIRMYEGELKYFYPNYRDYYYLPAEDTAIHKSVAVYVDKDHRMQAKADNCYSRKTGVFLPQYESGFRTPVFYKNYGDKITYFEYTSEFVADKIQLMDYVKHLMYVFGFPCNTKKKNRRAKNETGKSE